MAWLSHLLGTARWASCLAAVAFTAGQAAAEPRATSLFMEQPREVSFRLDAALAKQPTHQSVDLLLPFREASFEKLGPFRSYTQGPWGSWYRTLREPVQWGPALESAEAPSPPDGLGAEFSLVDAAPSHGSFADFLRLIPPDQLVRDARWVLRGARPFETEDAPGLFDTTGFGVRSDGLSNLFVLPPATPVPDWRCRRSPVLLSRSGGESERFELVRCDGTIAPLALDKLSILARPTGTERPFDELPDEPAAEDWSEKREWGGGVRLVHPRLLWVLQEIADAFPRRSIVIYSGVRPYALVNDGSGHKSLHASGRALDIAVHKIDKEDLFKVCASLRGVGCGFYPEGPFIHVDVRRADPGTAFWVDASAMGQEAQYVNSYPGLVEDGKLVFPLRKKGKR